MEKVLKRFAVSLLLGANLCTIALLWLCVGLTYISPDLLPRLSQITLAFPIFLAADISFLLFWLLFHARLAWIPLAGALCILPFALDYCPVRLSAQTNPPADTTLTILTYNVGGMSTKEKREELLSFINSINPDIICLQELPANFLANHKQWVDSAGYHHVQSHSVAIISRMTFIGDTIHIDYPTRSNHSIACWVNCHGDSLLVVNNHLESNKISEEEKVEYEGAIVEPHRQNIKDSSHKLLNRLSQAAAYRGAQADSLCALVQRNTAHSIILCGDLNETPISYTYQRLARQLTSAYREAGKGPGFTYSRRSFPVRIDHLFHSTDWLCNSCNIDKSISASDHYPLTVHLSKKKH